MDVNVDEHFVLFFVDLLCHEVDFWGVSPSGWLYWLIKLTISNCVKSTFVFNSLGVGKMSNVLDTFVLKLTLLIGRFVPFF